MKQNCAEGIQNLGSRLTMREVEERSDDHAITAEFSPTIHS
jgi:hypothetical protein